MTDAPKSSEIGSACFDDHEKGHEKSTACGHYVFVRPPQVDCKKLQPEGILQCFYC